MKVFATTLALAQAAAVALFAGVAQAAAISATASYVNADPNLPPSVTNVGVPAGGEVSAEVVAKDDDETVFGGAMSFSSEIGELSASAFLEPGRILANPGDHSTSSFASWSELATNGELTPADAVLSLTLPMGGMIYFNDVTAGNSLTLTFMLQVTANGVEVGAEHIIVVVTDTDLDVDVSAGLLGFVSWTDEELLFDGFAESYLLASLDPGESVLAGFTISIGVAFSGGGDPMGAEPIVGSAWLDGVTTATLTPTAIPAPGGAALALGGVLAAFALRRRPRGRA